MGLTSQMSWFDPSSWPIWLNIAAFSAAAAVVWFAGTRLAAHADAIAEITGLGSALIGMLLLGGITSMPEIAVTTSASLGGSAPLAVNNLLGGVALQVVVIAVGDMALRDRALSAAAPGQIALLQAVFSALLLLLVAAGIVVGDIAFVGIGVWSSAVLAAAIGLLWILSRYRDPPGKRPHMEGEGLKPERQPKESLGIHLGWTLVLAAAILVAGFVVARRARRWLIRRASARALSGRSSPRFRPRCRRSVRCWARSGWGGT